MGLICMEKRESTSIPFACLLPRRGALQDLVNYREELVDRQGELESENIENGDISQNAGVEAAMIQQLLHWLSV